MSDEIALALVGLERDRVADLLRDGLSRGDDRDATPAQLAPSHPAAQPSALLIASSALPLLPLRLTCKAFFDGAWHSVRILACDEASKSYTVEYEQLGVKQQRAAVPFDVLSDGNDY